MESHYTSLELFFILLFSFTSGDLPFRNTSLPWQVRVDDVTGRLTIEEIQAQLASGQGATPTIPRLGIKEYSWWTNCERGDVTQNATAFPQAIGLGASFDTDLVYLVADASSTEVHAYYNYFVKTGTPMSVHRALSCFSPNVDLYRDPRWGRGPVTERDWRSYFLPSYRRCVEAGAFSLICAYNSINGIPACANKKLLTDILRGEWNFTGYIVADAGEILNIITQHHYLNNSVDTAAECLKAGCNLEVQKGDNRVYYSIIDAIKQNKLTEEFVREQIKPLFYTRMRLGEFDPPEMNPYNLLDKDRDVLNNQHREVAVLAAVKSFVLLKKSDILPIKQSFTNIAIVGPMANDSAQLFGDYAPATDPKFITSPLNGLSRLANSVQYTSGCSDTFCTDYKKSSVIKTLKGAEAVFVCLGIGQAVQSEGNDRHNLSLPGSQLQILKDVTDNTDKPVILLLFTGGPVDINWGLASPRVTAILECFLPAQSAGDALYKSLTASEVGSVPGGRLPFTWPRDESQIPAMTNYSMAGRTYRHFVGDPALPFGYGLSYSSFSYTQLSCPLSVQAGTTLNCSVVVTNTGQYDADEVSQVYISWQNTSLPVPNLQLVGFYRQLIYREEGAGYWFKVDPVNMAVWKDDVGWTVIPGKMDLFVGGQQPRQKISVGSNILNTVFEIIGTKILGKF